MSNIIVLFHRNLRVADNHALTWAAERGGIVPVYIYADSKPDPYPIGAASRWWLYESLKDLSATLTKLGAPLILRRGSPILILRELIETTGAKAVTWQRRYEPHHADSDHQLASALRAEGIEVFIQDGFLLFDPKSILTSSGTPFKVFTPFSKACFVATSPPPMPQPAPKKLQGIKGIKSDELEDWKFVPQKAIWPKGLAAVWDVSEIAAHKRLAHFIASNLTHYKDQRDRPDIEGTSRLSPYLHFGQISPHQIWHAIQDSSLCGAANGGSIERFLLEILWREFSWHLLYQFPDLPQKPLIPSFVHFPWKKNDIALVAWQKGQTGYPLVDAGMRQLWQTGWMHNRVRMIVASFLIKDLLIDWREGEAWFWDTLLDADLGSNSASWQWVAGCGADAAPFFRIFNPVLQGKKFDPSGDYVRQYVPELSKLEHRWIHEPWAAPASELAKANITLGTTYPRPIVDHDKARKMALTALGSIKGSSAEIQQGNLLDLILP